MSFFENHKTSLKACFYRGVTFHSLLVTRWNWLVTRYSLQNSLVTRCKKITRYSLQNFLVTRCKTSFVTRCKIRLLLVAEVTRCEKSFVTRCKVFLLLVAKVARCKKSLITRCKISSLLVAEVEWLFASLWKSNSTTGAFLWIFAKL